VTLPAHLRDFGAASALRCGQRPGAGADEMSDFLCGSGSDIFGAFRVIGDAGGATVPVFGAELRR
jgi:hypothetical protein